MIELLASWKPKLKILQTAGEQEINYKDTLFTTQDNHLKRQPLLIPAQQLGRISMCHS